MFTHSFHQHSWVPHYRNHLAKNKIKFKFTACFGWIQIILLYPGAFGLFPCCFGSCPQNTQPDFPRWWQWNWRCKQSEWGYPGWLTCMFEVIISQPPALISLMNLVFWWLKENVLLSAKDGQVFISSWQLGARWGRLHPTEDFTNEEKRFKWLDNIFVIKVSRKESIT